VVSFFSAEFRRNPFPVYDHLREQTPILYDENTDALLVFDYDSVRLVLRLLSICALLVLAPCSARTQTATMTEDPAQGTVWDLRILYQAPAAWDAERATVEASLPSLARLKGTLGVSASSLQSALDRMGQTTQRLTRLDAYARLKADEDTSIAENQARVQMVTTLWQRFEEATAFVNPEILNIGRQQVEAFEAADPGLNRYKRPLELILRRRAHTLSPEGEGIIAATQSMRLQPGVTYSLMMYSDIPWPTVQVEGRSAAVDPEGYRRMLENPDRECGARHSRPT
jgi:oligoendopeptidase F